MFTFPSHYSPLKFNNIKCWRGCILWKVSQAAQGDDAEGDSVGGHAVGGGTVREDTVEWLLEEKQCLGNS